MAEAKEPVTEEPVPPAAEESPPANANAARQRGDASDAGVASTRRAIHAIDASNANVSRPMRANDGRLVCQRDTSTRATTRRQIAARGRIESRSQTKPVHRGRAHRGPRLDTRKRRLLIAAAIYLLVVDRVCDCRGPRANGDAHGIQSLRAPSRRVAPRASSISSAMVRRMRRGNDFADFQGKTYISFPPMPAVLMLPLVWLAGIARKFPRWAVHRVAFRASGLQCFFSRSKSYGEPRAAFEAKGRTSRSALAFAFGSVYFFTSVQGTVWFAAHVVGVGRAGVLLLLFSLDAERPMLAGFRSFMRVDLARAHASRGRLLRHRSSTCILQE